MLATAVTASNVPGGFPLLSALIFTPLVGAVIAILMPSRRPEYSRIVGYVTTAATGGFAVDLLVQFSVGTHGYQFVESHQWISAFGIRYLLGVDGISLFMVALTALLIPIGLVASADIERPKAFTVWLLILESALIAVFLSLDLVLFFVAFEFVLVPMYFLIAEWGHGNKIYAATKFYLYTAAGSAFLFVGLLSVALLYHHAGHPLTFDVRTLTAWTSANGNLSSGVGDALFLSFCVAFAVKVPLFPLHTWLPDAHTEAPTAGSVILAGVLLKMGTYGFLRFAIPMFPKAAVDLAPIFLVAGVIGITYGAIVAAMQSDLKRLVAYSSIAHLGFVVIGVFSLTTQGVEGGLFTMISHGLTTGALFLLIGMLSDRRHTRLIADFGGLWKAVPILGGLFVAATFASIGLPGFSGFIGEFLALIGTFISHRWYAVVATTGVIFAAVYLLWAVQRAFTGEPEGDNVGMRDITFRELATVVPLLGLSLFLGFYPKPVLDRVRPAVDDLITHVEQSTNYRAPSVSTAGTSITKPVTP
jgi:NADH-quinone oxidoreductase subunit M